MGKEFDDPLVDLLEARRRHDPHLIEAAQRAVIIRYLPIVTALARRYRHRGVDFDDLEQVGRVGLIKAVQKWQPGRGALPAYVKATVVGEIKRYFRDFGATIRVPRILYEEQPRVVAAIDALRQENSREPNGAEIASRTGIPESRVQDIRTAATRAHPLSNDGLTAFGEHAAVGVEAELSAAESRGDIRMAMAVLTDRERQIIAMRFVRGNSQVQIADLIGVSQMQVSRLLGAALNEMRSLAVA